MKNEKPRSVCTSKHMKHEIKSNAVEFKVLKHLCINLKFYLNFKEEEEEKKLFILASNTVYCCHHLFKDFVYFFQLFFILFRY